MTSAQPILHDPDELTIYASIGNSDDKLGQAEWSRYAKEFVRTIGRHAVRVHGEWYSESASPYQRACMAFGIGADGEVALRRTLTALRAEFRQDSIAWVVVREPTEFI